MKCEFSETQFVFGILHELVTRCWTPGRAWSAPVFPTQRQELHLGYDFKIKGCVRTLFFQFKTPEKKTTAKGKYWPEFGQPYYEFKIWPDYQSPQHNQLVDLANRDPRNRVYYCAPGFHTQDEFKRYYAKGKISGESIYIPCGTLLKISGWDRHDISYVLEPSRICVMHSQESRAEALSLEDLKEDAERADPYQSVEECFYRLSETFDFDGGYAEFRENAAAGFYRLANHLLMTKNLNLLLLGE